MAAADSSIASLLNYDNHSILRGMTVNTNTTARILRAAPIALAVALSVGACGALLRHVRETSHPA